MRPRQPTATTSRPDMWALGLLAARGRSCCSSKVVAWGQFGGDPQPRSRSQRIWQAGSAFYHPRSRASGLDSSVLRETYDHHSTTTSSATLYRCQNFPESGDRPATFVDWGIAHLKAYHTAFHTSIAFPFITSTPLRLLHRAIAFFPLPPRLSPAAEIDLPLDALFTCIKYPP